MKRFKINLAIAAIVLFSITVNAEERDCWYYGNYGDHDWEQVDVQMPTCTQQGSYLLECRICGLNVTEYTEGGTGHDWIKGTVVEATCTDYGYIEYICAYCGETETEDVMPYGHYWIESGGVAGTCTQPEYIYYKCDNANCGATTQETIPAAGHKWKDINIMQEATCIQAGSMKTQCTVCGITGSRTINTIDHKYGDWEVTTKATDHSQGEKTRTCIMCGNKKAEKFYPDDTLYKNINNREAVKKLQTMLKDCGYLNDKIDGAFGNKTEQAVKDFQKAAGISEDGIAWPQTIQLLTKEWEIKMGLAVPTEVPEKQKKKATVSKETENSEKDKEKSQKYCGTVEDEDGKYELVYCEEHKNLLEMANALIDSAKTEESRIKSVKHARALWEEELEILYAKWCSYADEESMGAILSGQAMFNAHIISQEKILSSKYDNNMAVVYEKISELLMEQCMELCEIVYEAGLIIVNPEEGYVGVSLVGDWTEAETAEKDKVILYANSEWDDETACIIIADEQAGNSLEKEMKSVQEYFKDKTFKDITIGENDFKYITNGKSKFCLIAETSSGSAMRVEGENCTVEQISDILEMIVIK